jgi:hypothetical protein
VLFTWVRRTDKTIHFEFLDNSVAYGELPRTVAFGTSSTLNVLDIAGMLDIVRFGRVNIDATDPASLYKEPALLAAEHNVAFLERCSQNFHEMNFANPATGRIYLRLVAGTPAFVDHGELQAALTDRATRAAILAIVPRLLSEAGSLTEPPRYLPPRGDKTLAPTIGQWGTSAP